MIVDIPYLNGTAINTDKVRAVTTHTEADCVTIRMDDGDYYEIKPQKNATIRCIYLTVIKALNGDS